ncbi:response regulator [Bacteroides sp. 51]|nr:response regulator [Bacteroides sp. 51]
MITPSYCVNLCEREDEKASTVMHTFRYVHPDDRKELLDFMQNAESGEVEPFCRDVRVMINNDEWKWIKIFLIQKEYAPHCKSNDIYSLSIDINEQKKTETILEEAKEKAEDANKSKSAFLANMSHEIRTPLNAILGFSELLASANTNEEKEQYLQIVRMNNEMLLQLINDILDIAKMEAGILEFTYSDVDINLLTSELDKQFDLKLKNNDKVKLVYEPSLPSCVLYTDRNRLTQVLFNFMSNALKFTSSGTIRMGFKSHEKGVYFYVSDTGIGIKEEKLGEVFGRFARFNKEKKGNGLGLSISKTIIEKLGGEIGLTSVYGEGSTFWFILPTDNRPQIKLEPVETKLSEDNLTTETVNSSETIPVEQKKYTILIAEDMPDNYHLCAAILSKRYHLLWAKNGEEAVSMFLEHQPDTILMDLKMPEVDGYAATEAIRQMSTTIPIIALTAFAYSEDRDRVMKSGFSDFMTKPVNAGLLLDKVESFCKHYNP